MKKIVIQICAWFTFIFFSVTSFVALGIIFTEKIDWAIIVTFIMFSLISVTGWHARKYGMSDYKTSGLSKWSAIISLISGIFFIVLIPVLTTNLFGFKDSYEAIRNLLILFTPVVISAIAVLSSDANKKTI